MRVFLGMNLLKEKVFQGKAKETRLGRVVNRDDVDPPIAKPRNR